MTFSQIQLLLKCMLADRTAETADHKLVEVGWINGVNPITAKSLVNAGLLVEDMPSYAGDITNTHVRLPNLEELQQRVK